MNGIDAIDTAVEPPVAEGGGAVSNSVDGCIVSTELSPAAVEVGGGGEKDAKETVSLDSSSGGATVVVEGREEKQAASIVKKGYSVAERSGGEKRKRVIYDAHVYGGGSDSDSSPKKRRTRSRSKSGSAIEWASKELLDVVAHMRRGDRSFLPPEEVHLLLLEYIEIYKLRDPCRKSQVICDIRLQKLFGKSHVGHFEMLNLLETQQHQAGDIQRSIVNENLDHPMKSGKDKTREKGVRKGRQSSLDDFAAVDMHNINLIYLRRSLVEDLLEDSTSFDEKVASAFVRLRISGNQKQDLYQLVQVVGTSKAPEPYKVGKKTTDFVLEILNLEKNEVISIDIISDQDFTEDECKRLKQSIKCGLINRLTVGDIQEKAMVLQEVRVKNLLEAEIPLLQSWNNSGRGSMEERQRRLEEIPEIHADPKMDPDCESEDDDEKEDMEKEKHLRQQSSSSFNRRGRDPISPRKGGFRSNEPWTGTGNYSNTSANRELCRGSTGRGDYPGSSEGKSSDSMWTAGREREMQQSLGSEKPRSVVVVPQNVRKSVESEILWHYKDPSGKVQGPFSMAQLCKWNNTGCFSAKLEIWKAKESPLDSILLTDALAGIFQKQTRLVDNSFIKAQVAAYSGQSSESELKDKFISHGLGGGDNRTFAQIVSGTPVPGESSTQAQAQGSQVVGQQSDQNTGGRGGVSGSLQEGQRSGNDGENCVRVFWDMKTARLPQDLNMDVVRENILRGLVQLDNSLILGRLTFFGEFNPDPDFLLENTDFVEGFERYCLCDQCIRNIQSSKVEEKIDINRWIEKPETAVSALQRWVYAHARCNWSSHKKDILIITGDVDFAWMINDLRTKGFRVLLAYPNGADVHLREPSMAAWELRELLNGQAPRYHRNIQ